MRLAALKGGHNQQPNAILSRNKDLLSVLAFALLLRLIFAALVGGTYDYDEFVNLLLARDFSRGAIPYHGFMFFHPPGMLVLFRVLEPLTSWWWPSGRIVMLLADTLTAGLVWRIGCQLFNRSTGLAAGLIYGLSPLALISAVRIGQDPLITLACLAGLALLVTRPHPIAAVLAGICLGLATWMKYPALIFVPIYLLAAPRRTVIWAPVGALTTLAGTAPFLGYAHDFWYDTVTFQRTRWLMELSQRVETTAIFWLGANPLAPLGLLRTRRPFWLPVGFLLGGFFVFSPQVYYHYFAPLAPLAALLAAPLAVGLLARSKLIVPGIGLSIVLGFAALIDFSGPSPLYITAAHLSNIQPTINLIRIRTSSNRPLLADRYEYAYLADRPALAHYFWNIGVSVNARYLERRLRPAGAVVLSFGASSGYPAGFIDYLNHRYRLVHTRANSVWLVHPSHEP